MKMTAELYNIAIGAGIKPAKLNKVKDYMEIAKSNRVSCTFSNSKCGPLVLCSNLPAAVTCRADAPCKKWCYTQHGPQAYANVQQAYFRNYQIWLNNPQKYWSDIQYDIDTSGVEYFRINDSGDIPNYSYFCQLCEFCVRNSNVHFSMFTAQYEIVNEYLDNFGILPENLILRFSYKNRAFDRIIDNRHNLPGAYVATNDSSESFFDKTTTYHCDCKKTCSACKHCFKVRDDVYFDKH